MSRHGSASPTDGHCDFLRCMRPCLKSPLPSPGFGTPQLRKNVSFNDSLVEDVHIADEWDRTPSEPVRKLSYQDILELKEIQRTLPRANQLDDPCTGKRAPHYLSSVPVGLLPLLPESPKTPDSSTYDSPAKPLTPASPQPKAKLNWMPLAPPPAPSIPTTQRAWHPPDLSHLTPAKPPPPRVRPSFAFLPLLDTTPPVETDIPSDSEASTDPPTPSLTNASLDSSPRSHVSSSLESSPEFTSVSLPPSRFERRTDFGAPYLHGDDCDSSSFDEGESTLFCPPSHRLGHGGAWGAFPTNKKRSPSISPERPAVKPAVAPAPAKKRNIMVLNGIEIDLDELEDAVSTPRTTSPRFGVLTTPTPTPVESNTPSVSPHSSPDPKPIDLPPITKPPNSPTKPPLSPILSTSPTKRCGSPLCSPLLFHADTRTRSAAT